MTEEAKKSELEIHFGDPDADTCTVSVNRTLGVTAPVYYSTVEEAKGDPLAQRLVAVEGLEAVLLQGDTITLLKPADGSDWAPLQERVRAAITEHFQELDRQTAEGEREMTEEEKELALRVQEVLNVDINPLVASHGGFIEVLGVKEKTLYIHMGGGCQGCGMASVTLKQGVERAIFERIPEIERILDTTDHAAGTNPYYAPATK